MYPDSTGIEAALGTLKTSLYVPLHLAVHLYPISHPLITWETSVSVSEFEEPFQKIIAPRRRCRTPIYSQLVRSTDNNWQLAIGI